MLFLFYRNIVEMILKKKTKATSTEKKNNFKYM